MFPALVFEIIVNVMKLISLSPMKRSNKLECLSQVSFSGESNICKADQEPAHKARMEGRKGGSITVLLTSCFTGLG
jgi:hypothetical protein